MVVMNADQVAALRALLGPSGWMEQTQEFSRALRVSARTPGGLLLVGTPDDEPWHLTAHLDDESRLAGIPGLGSFRRFPPPRRRLRQANVFERLRGRHRDQLIQGFFSKYLVHPFAVSRHGRRNQPGVGHGMQFKMLSRMS